MANRTIYAIPGMGVDQRIYYSLRLTYELKYLDWLQPLAMESLESYAERMAAHVPPDEECTLMGLSFGGVIAQEICKIRPVKQLILLSTIKSSAEKPWKMEFMKYIPLYYLSQGSLRLKIARWMAPEFGIRTKEDIELLIDMFSQFDDEYRMWAIRQICHWEGKEPGIPLLHIHGDKDRFFPIEHIKDPYRIQGGYHYMVKQRAAEISEIINQWLDRNIIIT